MQEAAGELHSSVFVASENAFAGNQDADFANAGTEGFYWETELSGVGWGDREGESSTITRRL